MICFPNAKINLGLHVIGKRPDGFHNIETVFYPITLSDALEIIISDKEIFEFTYSGLPVPGDPDSNLVLKAVNLMSIADYPSPGPSPAREGRYRYPESGIRHPAFAIRIHLHKVIPMGTGLGGGSSDGAHAIKLLNDLWKLELTTLEMQDLARQLGSDCAFFIENHPMFASGRGDQFEPVDLDLSGYKIVVVVPPVHVSTQEAYAMVTPGKPERSLKEIIRLPVEEWKELLTNDFEKPVMNKYPVIQDIKEELYSRGAVYAAMSGSGSAVYGIFSRQSAFPTAIGSGWQVEADYKVFHC